MMLNDNEDNNDDSIRAAIALLQSIGVRNLCLDRHAVDAAALSSSGFLHNGDDEDDQQPWLLPWCQQSAVVDPQGEQAISSSSSSMQMMMMTTTTTMPSKYQVIFNIIGSLFMVGLIALMSGLFLGLLTLEILDLQIIGRVSTDEKEKEYAHSILPVVKDRHRLLVTLMIVNAFAYESLPLFLDNLVPSWVAVLLSTTAILLFGEILPSGVFMGPNQLYLGHLFIPAAKFFLWILYPIAVPLGRLLDVITDTSAEGTAGALEDEEYTRDELIALVQIQHERRLSVQTKLLTTRKEVAAARRLSSNSNNITSVNGTSSSSDNKHHHHNNHWSHRSSGSSSHPNDNNDHQYHHHYHRKPSSAEQEQTIIEIALGEEESAVEQLHPPLHQREVDLVEGALTMKTQTAIDVYTPYRDVYAVSDHLILTKATITEIYSHGYSRVPVYRYNDKQPDDTSAVLGFLITRQLMLIDWDDGRLLSTLPLQRPVCVSPKTNLVELFDTLQTNGLLLTFVCASPLLANKALKQGQPMPSTSGIMGICTLVDVMESILQDRIYDEGDIRERDRAVAILQQWASDILSKFLRKTARTLKRQRSITGPSGGGGNGGFNGMNGSFSSWSGPLSPSTIGSPFHNYESNGSTSSNNKNNNNNTEQTPLLWQRQQQQDDDDAADRIESGDYGGTGEGSGGDGETDPSGSEESNETAPLMKYSKQS
jgi:metal transporter CNNM